MRDDIDQRVVRRSHSVVIQPSHIFEMVARLIRPEGWAVSIVCDGVAHDGGEGCHGDAEFCLNRGLGLQTGGVVRREGCAVEGRVGAAAVSSIPLLSPRDIEGVGKFDGLRPHPSLDVSTFFVGTPEKYLVS